jgi:hypothetical protein
MKISELTEDQVLKIVKVKPEWVIKNFAKDYKQIHFFLASTDVYVEYEWMFDHFPGYMIIYHSSWVAMAHAELLADRYPEIAFKYNPDWMVKNRAMWVYSHNSQWMSKNYPEDYGECCEMLSGHIKSKNDELCEVPQEIMDILKYSFDELSKDANSFTMPCPCPVCHKDVRYEITVCDEAVICPSCHVSLSKSLQQKGSEKGQLFDWFIKLCEIKRPNNG